jgi:hypothetical protein
MLRITHVEMLPLETKQSADKLLPHSDLRRECFWRKDHAAIKKLGHIARYLLQSLLLACQEELCSME